MRKLLFAIGLVAVVYFGIAGAGSALAAAAPERTVQERLDDLEAYMNNAPRNASTNAATKIPGPGPGHNAWMMTSSALVLFMTLPGLALFYGGLVRRKNVLSVLGQCLGIAGLVTILWWLVGYSLAFHSGETARGWSFFGKVDWAFLRGVDSTPNSDYSNWVSHNVYSMYQLMFAIITPALIIGAIAERMKYSAVLLFVGIWMFVVYFPLAHMIWGVDGMMNGGWQSQGADSCHRFRRRDGRAHVLRLVGADSVPDPGQAAGLRQRADATA